MKWMLVLMAVAMLSAAAIGCQNNRWFHRTPCASATVDPCMTAPSVQQPVGTYLPAPG